MKNFKVSSTKVMLAALVVIVGLGLGTGASGAEKAATGDTGDMTVPKSVTTPPPRGATYVLAPDLIGKTEGEAKKELSKVGLKLGELRFTTSAKGKPGTVAKQTPPAKTKVVKGSKVDVVVLKAAAKISPKIVQKGEKVFMEFSETVKDVIISDAKGNKLQQFKQGKRFDITGSVIKTKAGLLKVTWEPTVPDKLYMPGPPSGGTAVDTKHTANFDASRYINEDVFRKQGIEQAAKTTGKIPKLLEVDDTFIENGEPGNNTIFYTLPGPKLYSGNVGAPGDPVDRLAFTSGPSPNGTVITVHVVSGNVNVTLYYGSLLMANPLVENGNNFWIAVLPSDYIYFSVQPAGTGASPYTIAVSHKYILNPNEAQQTENNPMQLHLGGGTREGALIPRFSGSDWEDWFFVQLPQSQRLRIIVTDAELPTYNRVRIGICPEDSNNAYEEVIGTYNGATLETWQSYPGTWKIRVALAGPGVEFHGTGNIPSCYRKPYKIRAEAIP